MDPTERLTDLPGWSRAGEAITKTYKLRDFTSAMAFVNDVADIAESANHHPTSISDGTASGLRYRRTRRAG